MFLSIERNVQLILGFGFFFFFPEVPFGYNVQTPWLAEDEVGYII